jgi:hypothetical protein
VTRSKYDFAAEDRALARNAHKLLREFDDRDDMLSVFMVAMRTSDDPEPARLAAMARFGWHRWCDAQRGRPERPDGAEDDWPAVPSTVPQQYEATALERSAHDRLRRAVSELHLARGECERARSLRAEIEATLTHTQGATRHHDGRLMDALDVGVDALERAVSSLERTWRPEKGPDPSNSFPSLWGMSTKERAEGLRRQFRALMDAGWTPDKIAILRATGAEATDLDAPSLKDRTDKYMRYPHRG